MNNIVENKFKLRPWQSAAVKKIDNAYKSGKTQLMAVNACVGSGKTYTAAYAFGKFISDHRDASTVSVFVSPRIKLCAQQTDSLAEDIEKTFGLKNGVDYKILQVDCQHDDFNRRDDYLGAKHAIFVVCDKSLWGKSETEGENKGDPMARWKGWLRRFNAWKNAGRLFGAIFYDEAHNYSASQDKMFGKEFHNA